MFKFPLLLLLPYLRTKSRGLYQDKMGLAWTISSLSASCGNRPVQEFTSWGPPRASVFFPLSLLPVQPPLPSLAKLVQLRPTWSSPPWKTPWRVEWEVGPFSRKFCTSPARERAGTGSKSRVRQGPLCAQPAEASRPWGQGCRSSGKWDTEFLFSQELTTAYTYWQINMLTRLRSRLISKFN